MRSLRGTHLNQRPGKVLVTFLTVRTGDFLDLISWKGLCQTRGVYRREQLVDESPAIGLGAQGYLVESSQFQHTDSACVGCPASHFVQATRIWGTSISGAARITIMERRELVR